MRVRSFPYVAGDRGACRHGVNVIGDQLMPCNKQMGKYGTGGFISGHVTHAPENLLSFPFLKLKV